MKICPIDINDVVDRVENNAAGLMTYVYNANGQNAIHKNKNREVHRV